MHWIHCVLFGLILLKINEAVVANASAEITTAKLKENEKPIISRPRNLVVYGIGPTKVLVMWKRPAKATGKCIWYEIRLQWQTDEDAERPNQSSIYTKCESIDDPQENYLNATITNLMPNQMYGLRLRAHISDMMYSQTSLLQLVTPSVPSPNTLFSSTFDAQAENATTVHRR